MSKIDAIGFALKCQNWEKIALPIARHQKPTKIVLRNGMHFEADALHWWDMDDIFFKHVYNPLHLQLEENDLVVDIGANIGVFTVYAASITRNMIYSYEPSTSNFAYLQQNILANGLKNVIPYNLAISDKRGIEMFTDSDDGTARKLKRINPDKTEQYIEVSTITLQDVMDNNGIERIDFLKMDCEGSEGLILGSTPKNYLERINKIAMEFHDGISSIKHDGMQKILEEAGFTTTLDWNGKSRLGHLYGWRN